MRGVAITTVCCLGGMLVAEFLDTASGVALIVGGGLGGTLLTWLELS